MCLPKVGIIQDLPFTLLLQEHTDKGGPLTLRCSHLLLLRQSDAIILATVIQLFLLHPLCSYCFPCSSFSSCPSPLPSARGAVCNYPVCLHLGSNCLYFHIKIRVHRKRRWAWLLSRVFERIPRSLTNMGVTSMSKHRCISQLMCASPRAHCGRHGETERGTLSSLIPLFWVRLELSKAFARPAECGFKD